MLSEMELRILGALLEKERTTPDTYPLTTNALVLACNQKTNRDPVVSYSHNEVSTTLVSLRDKGYVKTERGMTERSYKHSHLLERQFDLRARDMAVLAVLILRGAQTPGELRSRTERYIHFDSVAMVEEALARLEQHSPALARNLGRGAGQSQDRWMHTLGGKQEERRPRARLSAELRAKESDMQSELEELKAKVSFLYAHLGLEEEAT